MSVPFWFLLAAVSVLPCAWSLLRRRRRLRRAEGSCARCGYDLRATPGQCPECGATATTPA